MPTSKANYTKPTSQLDLEARLENGNASPLRLTDAPSREGDPVREDGVRDFRVKGNDVSNYVAVDPIYQNYAEDTHKPMRAEKGAEAEVFDRVENQGKAVEEFVARKQAEAEKNDEANAPAEPDTATVSTPASPPTPGDSLKAEDDKNNQSK